MSERSFLLHGLLEDSARRAPDAVALVEQMSRVSYGELERGANRVANALLAAGVERGDRVALLAQSSRFYVENYYGAMKAGACVVPLNTALKDAALGETIRHAGAKVLCAGRGCLRVVRAALTGLDTVQRMFVELPVDLGALPSGMTVTSLSPDEGDDSCPRVPVVDDDLASIVYTSGSTGRAQGVALTHKNLVANTRSILAYLRLGPEDRAFSVLPFFYIYGTSVLNTHIAVGGSLVLENQLTFVQAAIDRLEEEHCTGLSGVPSTFALLLHRSTFAERALPHLRYVTQAGGAMSPTLTRRLMAALPGKRIYVMYGATEAGGRLAYLPPEELPREVGAIGRAIDDVELRLLGPDGREVDVGEEGEIVVRGDCIMRGYWEDPEETARVLDDAGYHTGDIGIRNERGFITVVGRTKEMLKSGGHRISPKEIEDALLEHGGVHEAAVIGVPDELLGEAIRAHVVPINQSFDVEELRSFLARRLAAYKLPRSIVVEQELPKNGSGKVDKLKLLEPAAVLRSA